MHSWGSPLAPLRRTWTSSLPDGHEPGRPGTITAITLANALASEHFTEVEVITGYEALPPSRVRHSPLRATAAAMSALVAAPGVRVACRRAIATTKTAMTTGTIR